MAPLSRDDRDATHSLFVLDRPDLPTRFLFVNERTGETTTFRALRDAAGVTVARQPGGAFVRLTPSLPDDSASTVARRESEGIRAAVERSGGDGYAFHHVPSPLTARWHGGRLDVADPATDERVIVQPNAEDLGGHSSTYDVWVDGRHSCETTAFGVVVECMMLRRFERPTAIPPHGAP